MWRRWQAGASGRHHGGLNRRRGVIDESRHDEYEQHVDDELNGYDDIVEQHDHERELVRVLRFFFRKQLRP